MTETACESCGYPMAGPEDHAPGHPDSRYCRFCSTEYPAPPMFEAWKL